MDSLDGRTEGRYRVTTTSARYLIDLGAMRLVRTAADRDDAIRTLREDDEPVALLRLIQCQRTRPMVLDIDLHVPGVTLTRRTTTEVVHIEPLEPPAE